MNYAVALASLVLFTIGFRFARISTLSTGALRDVQQAVAQIGDRTLSEDQKEQIARNASMALFGRFLTIAALTAAVLIAPALLLLLAVQTGAVDAEALEAALFSPWLIGAAFLLIGAEFWFRR